MKSRAASWQLPDGALELPPQDAAVFESLRTESLDLFRRWGYQLVRTPLLERMEALPPGRDLERLCFRIDDGDDDVAPRPDITPQTARIDARAAAAEPARLCYAGSVLHKKPRHAQAQRELYQIGAELYGGAGIEADLEIISLMVETAKLAGLPTLHLDIGHIGIHRALCRSAGVDADIEEAVFAAVRSKSVDELEAALPESVSKKDRERVRALIELHGDGAVLDDAARRLKGAPEAVAEALDELREIEREMRDVDGVQLYFDLGEMRGWRYHTGVVFAVYVEGFGEAVALGGRCDGIGAHFGAARAAVGFNIELGALLEVGAGLRRGESAVFAARDAGDADERRREIERLRAEGECVVDALPGQTAAANCDRRLICEDGQWRVVEI